MYYCTLDWGLGKTTIPDSKDDVQLFLPYPAPPTVLGRDR